MPRGSRAGGGYYKLLPALEGDSASPILIEGVDAGLADVVFPVATLDEKQYMYTMGKEFSTVLISGMVLLGKWSQEGKAFNKVIKYFEDYRVAKYSSPIKCTLPGGSCIVFYLTHFVVGKPDPQFNIQYFTFRGTAVEPKPA